MHTIILIALLAAFYSGSASAAHSGCGGQNENACPAWYTGPPCEQGLRKNDAGKCKACGGDGERACRVIDKGKQCDAGLIYRAGYCTNRNIACGTEGSPPCHWLKQGARCKDPNTATIDGICQSCGTLFNRACPIAERGNNCVSGTKYRKGVCVPASVDDSAPKSRIYNMSDDTIFAEMGNWGSWEIEADGYVEFEVPEVHCVDHSQGFANPGNETYFNVGYFMDLTQAKCSQYGEVTFWQNKADYTRHQDSDELLDIKKRIRSSSPHLQRTNYIAYRQSMLRERTEAVSPGGDLHGMGARGIIRAPDRDSWMAYWGPATVEAGRMEGDYGGPSGLESPSARTDPRLRRLYGGVGSQWLICPPDAPAGCRSEEISDYPVNGVGSWWEYLDGDQIVEFVFMDEDKLVAKRLGLDELRHYRHYEKVGTNRYKSPWNNVYQFASSTTGYWESAKTGRQRQIRRTRSLSSTAFLGAYDGVLETTINNDTRRRIYTYIIKTAPTSSMAFSHPNKLKVKRLDRSSWEDFEISDGNTNLYTNGKGSSIRFYEGTNSRPVHMDFSDGSLVTAFSRIGDDSIDLEGDWKVDRNSFEITKQRKDKLEVKGLVGSGKTTFQRRKRNAYYFRDNAGNVLRYNNGLWYRPKGGSAQRVVRD